MTESIVLNEKGGTGGIAVWIATESALKAERIPGPPPFAILVPRFGFRFSTSPISKIRFPDLRLALS